TLPSQHDGRVRVSGEAGECALSTPRGMSARPTSCCQTEGWHGIGVQTKAAMSMANSAAGSPFRGGVIGFGAAGSLFHSPFIAATPGLRLTTIVTGDRARAEQAQAEYPGVVVRSTADELWAAADVDLVVVAAPNVAHVPLASRAIEA